MLFRRRHSPPIGERIRHTLWPRAGWGRAALYLGKRALRISATPHAVAAGLAMGALCSFTPFMGLHFLLAFALTAVLGGNMLAAALGTAVGNPLTFPFIWALSYRLGRDVLGHAPGPSDAPVNLLERSFLDLGPTLLWPMVVGGLLMGLPVAVAIYVAARTAVAAFQRQRRERLSRTALGAS